MAAVNFRLAAENWDYQLGHLLHERTVKKNRLSGYTFGGTDVFFTRTLSSSLIADFAVARTYFVDGIPEVGLSRQKVRIGNLGTGFSLGINM